MAMENANKNYWQDIPSVPNYANYIIEQLKLNDSNNEEKNLIDFFNNLAFISQLRIGTNSYDDNLSGLFNSKVYETIVNISQFVISLDTDNEELQHLFGFNNNMEFSEDDIEKMDNCERIYLIADLKLKASIFLIRTANFCRKAGCETKITLKSYAKDLRNARLSDILSAFCVSNNDTRSLSQYIDLSGKEKESINLTDEAREYFDVCTEFLIAANNNENEKARKVGEKAMGIEQKLAESKDNGKPVLNYFSNIDCIGKNLLSDMHYYIFDNSMHEVEFVGLSHYWLWRYLPDKKTLFRCVGTNEFISSDKKFYYLDIDNNTNSKALGRTYYRKMIENIVMHMNKGDYNKLSSYSKNPFLDIYKYMSIRGEVKCTATYVKYDMPENRLIFEFPEPVTNDKCIFAMVRNAETNIVKSIQSTNDVGNYDFSIDGNKYNCTNGNGISFSQLISGEVNSGVYGFCVDLLNNYAPRYYFTPADVREAFSYYASHFIASKSELQRPIVAPSDKEVIMLGNTSDNIVMWEPGFKYESVRDNIEYRVDLNFKEIVGLFWRIACVIGNTNDITETCMEKNLESISYGNYYGTTPIIYFAGKQIAKFENINYTENSSEINTFSYTESEIRKSLCRQMCETAKEYAENAKEKLDFIIDFIINTTEIQDFNRTVYRENDSLLDLYRYMLLY